MTLWALLWRLVRVVGVPAAVLCFVTIATSPSLVLLPGRLLISLGALVFVVLLAVILTLAGAVAHWLNPERPRVAFALLILAPVAVRAAVDAFPTVPALLAGRFGFSSGAGVGIVTGLRISRLCRGSLRQLDLWLPSGLGVVLGRPEDGTGTLVAVAAGLGKAKRGSVSVAGADPFQTPSTRGAIGALLEHEDLAEGTNVDGALRRTFQYRGEPGDSRAVLRHFGLGTWSERNYGSLSPAERRSIALVLALSLARPSLLVLHEPLRHTAGLDSRQIAACLREMSQRCPVLITTGSPEDALRLGGVLYLLEGGRLVREFSAAATAELCPGGLQWLRIRSSKARELAAQLSLDSRVSAVRLDLVAAPDQLLITGQDAATLVQALVEVAVSGRLPVDAWETGFSAFGWGSSCSCWLDACGLRTGLSASLRS